MFWLADLGTVGANAALECGTTGVFRSLWNADPDLQTIVLSDYGLSNRRLSRR